MQLIEKKDLLNKLLTTDSKDKQLKEAIDLQTFKSAVDFLGKYTTTYKVINPNKIELKCLPNVTEKQIMDSFEQFYKKVSRSLKQRITYFVKYNDDSIEFNIKPQLAPEFTMIFTSLKLNESIIKENSDSIALKETTGAEKSMQSAQIKKQIEDIQKTIATKKSAGQDIASDQEKIKGLHDKLKQISDIKVTPPVKTESVIKDSFTKKPKKSLKESKVADFIMWWTDEIEPSEKQKILKQLHITNYKTFEKLSSNDKDKLIKFYIKDVLKENVIKNKLYDTFGTDKNYLIQQVTKAVKIARSKYPAVHFALKGFDLIMKSDHNQYIAEFDTNLYIKNNKVDVKGMANEIMNRINKSETPHQSLEPGV